MKDNATDITIVLDRSGSMTHVKPDTMGGFNQFLKEQKQEPGEATLSLTTFSDLVEPQYTKPIADAPELSDENYKTWGNTALLDGIGRSIVATGNRLSAIPEAQRPAKVLFVIMTDGYENASKEYNYEKIAEMLKLQQETYKWQFLFIGADQDAIQHASRLGITADRAISTANNKAGVDHIYASLSGKVKMYRSAAGGQSANVSSWDDQDRDAQKKAGSF